MGLRGSGPAELLDPSVVPRLALGVLGGPLGPGVGDLPLVVLVLLGGRAELGADGRQLGVFLRPLALVVAGPVGGVVGPVLLGLLALLGLGLLGRILVGARVELDLPVAH